MADSRKLAVLCLSLLFPAAAEVNRIVILKVDGLPEGLVERYVAENAGGGRQGHSRLPWIQHVFARNGVWMENFYVRGFSLSAPSWSLLDTGQHLVIRGNAEYDRYTLRVADYLNFFPFYLGYVFQKQVDMPGVEQLDEAGVPLLIDRFPSEQRFQGLQLYQRGVRWRTFQSTLKSKFTSRPLKDLFDEWQTGFTMSSSVTDQVERELLDKLKDPRIHYLDYFTGEFDHVAHLTPDRIAQRHTVESVDALVGRVWTGIAASPLADTTLLVLVSDHGMNTTEGVYSQGYNLVDWFNSAAGGAHHVVTNRHPMTEFKLKGLDPFVSEVISPSPAATYLAGESAHYPTAVLDLDGNERASIGLRNNSLNLVQILLDQLMHKRLPGHVRHAALEALFETLDRVRPVWQRKLDELAADLEVLRTRMVELVAAQTRHEGLDQAARRKARRLENWKEEEHSYAVYAATMRRLLSLDPSDFDPGKFKTEELIPRKSLCEPNSIRDLQHYVTGLSESGLATNPNGSLDMERSFRYVDYFSGLAAIAVRNNVQKDVGPRPVDFIAVPLKDNVWLRASEDRQALISTRHDAAGRLELRFTPVAHLTEDSTGELHYESPAWDSGFPLALFEDQDARCRLGRCAGVAR